MERQTSTFTSWEKLRDLDLVAFLTSIGYEPCKTSGANYWYLSPLRAEKTASFKVNTRLNRWWDFGVGKGGSIIDFCLEYYKTELSEVVQLLSTQVFSPPPSSFSREMFLDQPALRITEIGDLSSKYLQSYLKNRGITVQLAASVVNQVQYNLNGKSYYGLGFQNDLGGFEIRSIYFKGSTTPKAETTLGAGHNILSVFEGFFDFLSYLTLRQKMNWPETDYLILNSLSFIKRSLGHMLSYRQIKLFLDLDPSGRKATKFLLGHSSAFQDCSFYYHGCKDLNEFLTQPQAKRKVSQKHRS